jgi:hypothetical protein
VATKLNRFGLALTACFALGGLALLLGPFFGFSYGNRINGVFWFGVACLVLWRWRRGNTEAARRERIVETGVRGTATVVSASSQSDDRGLPTLRLRLELDVPGIDPRQVDHEEEVPVYVAHGIKRGLRLPVVIGPDGPDNLVLVW